MPDIKPGVRLPTSDLDWKLAHDFFVGALPIADVNNNPINVVVSQMNLIIYMTIFIEILVLLRTRIRPFL